MTLLRGLNAQRALTIVMVTHELDVAAFAKRTVRFVDGVVQSDMDNPEAA
jgi:putative ABC transport system ATP-binding protein